jgi:hypothetical protein
MSEVEMKKMGGVSRSAVLQRLIRGELKVLFTTPEQAFSSSCLPCWKEMIAQNKISRIVVDEAHLLKQWENFRTQFQNFGILRKCFPGVPMLLMTACLPRETRSHLSNQIGFTHVMISRCYANRRNAFYMVQRKICDCMEGASSMKDEFRKIRGPTLDRLVCLLRGPFRGASAIIYCRTTTLTGIMSSYLRQNICDGVSRHFHAQLSQEERLENQKHWTESLVPVMVATSAFGLGINHPHVRLIVHWDMPQTLDDYFQQAGRAGRDGAPCLILSFYHPNDLDGTLNLGVSQPHRTVEVAGFMEQHVYCRRALILSEYAEPCPPSRCQSSCDVCYYHKTWRLYDISRFANSLLALVLYLPQHIEPLDVKRDPFKWLVSLLRGDDKSIKSLLTNPSSASLCKTGIIPGYGSMKNLCKDDAHTIVLSLFEHGVFKVTKQESKQFAKNQQCHMWKIEPGDDVFPKEFSDCKSERLQRLVKPRYIHPMLIPLPTITIQRLQKPVGGTWDDSPDHALFCGWCKERCFVDSLGARQFPCAPILGHKYCMDEEHDDEENRAKYDNPDTCMLCRNSQEFCDSSGKKKSTAQQVGSELIVCSACNKDTCYLCLRTLYELDEEAIKVLTSLESAKWLCANCDPFTVPLCYQWYRAERIQESGTHKDVSFRKRDEPSDLLSTLLQQSHTHCEQALQFCEKNITYMEDDLLPSGSVCTDEFPLCSFVTLKESGDSLQHYYMVMSHSNAGAYVYVVEFVVNSRSNALQPPKPQLNDLFDDKILLRFDCRKIKKINVDTMQCVDLDGDSNVWCPLNTVNKIKRELLAKIRTKQKYRWTRLDILPPLQSATELMSTSQAVVAKQQSSSTLRKPLLNNSVDSEEKIKTVAADKMCKQDKQVPIHLPSLLKKRHSTTEQAFASKLQKSDELPSVAPKMPGVRKHLVDSFHRTSDDAAYCFSKKDARTSFDQLFVSLLSHTCVALPIDPAAVRLSQGSLASSEYGEFSIYHAIFIALYQAELPLRSVDIALVIQSMGFSMLYLKTSSFAKSFANVIQNTLANHHQDFPGGIFQCKKDLWFLNPSTKMVDSSHSKNLRSTMLSKKEIDDPVKTEATTFGRCLNVYPNTFLRVLPVIPERNGEEHWYCMVTQEKGSGRWSRSTEDQKGTEILVRWFEVPKKESKPVYGARELYAYEGGTEQAWDWIHTDSILEVISVKWGLPEPHEMHWFEFYYTKNVNTFIFSSTNKKHNKECCISDCHPVQFQEDFWDENLLEYSNPDPFESKLYVDLQHAEIFDDSFVSKMLIESEKAPNDSMFDYMQDRRHVNLVCARNLMSRYYSHSRATKMNIRNCYWYEYANLFEAIIFTLLQKQSPMPIGAVCDEIGVRPDFRVDLIHFCKNALSPDIFWVDNFVEANGLKSKDEYISLKIWEVALEVYRKIDSDSGSREKDKVGREGVSWKRAYDAVSKLHPRASNLFKCALIANTYPLLCDRHQNSSAPAANFLHEITKAVDFESIVKLERVPIDPEALKIIRWGIVSREIMKKSARPNLDIHRSYERDASLAPKLDFFAAPAHVDCILISDDEPSSHVIDLDAISDDDEFCEVRLRRKRPLEQSRAMESYFHDEQLCQKLGPDDQIVFKFALLLCFKGLQSNLTFQLSKFRDKISHFCPLHKNVMRIVELAALTLQDRDILVYNASSSEKECDPSPCFLQNVDKGLVTSVSDSLRPIVNSETTSEQSIKANAIGNSTANDLKIPRLRTEFSFVAPPECQSFQDQKVFLRSCAESNDISTTTVTRFTSMYSHFSDFETAISYLSTLEEDEKNHPPRSNFHPVVHLVEGRFNFIEPQDDEDENVLEFEEHKSIRQDDELNPEAFKPFCPTPDRNFPDYRKIFETFSKLDFEVAYSIEHFISNGGLLWNALDHQDLEKLERYSTELMNARKLPTRDAYMQILNKIKVQLTNKVNLEKMKNQVALDKIFEDNFSPVSQKNKVERKKVASEDIQAMERCTVFSGVFQDKRGVKLKPSVYGKFSCRAYRTFGSDRFITVSIPRGAAPESVRCLLDHGFKTISGERLYRFIPSGDSNLKERKLMFFAVSGQHLNPILPQSFLQWHIPLSRDPNSVYFSNSEIISIKFFARFQLCFSASAVAMTLSPDEYEYIDDIDLEVPGTSKKVCATDGCGRAPPEFFLKIKEAFKLAYIPSCVQMRLGGCKGLLHVDTSVSKVQFRRKSQRKYVCDDSMIEQRQIEVTSWSPSHQSATSDMSAKLNLQLAFVLRSMGVPDDFFYSLLKDTRELVLGAVGKGSTDKEHHDAALDFVRKYKGLPQCEVIKEILEQNILEVTHPFVVRGLKHAIDLLLNPIQSSFHMPVPEMKFLYGVPDPTGLLEYGQCFVFLGEAVDGAIHRRFEDTEEVVGRNPMQHPGDVRKLTAVFVPELYNMKLVNVIVFPVKCNPETGQLLNDEMSGGDFDGDQYIFIWNREITKHAQNHEPYPYYLDGKSLGTLASSVTSSSRCDAHTELLESSDTGTLELCSSQMLGPDTSKQHVADTLTSTGSFITSSHGPGTLDVTSPILLSSLLHPIEDGEGPSLHEFPVASSDPSRWTSDDVKRHFSNKIGSSPEEAYEKLKLCALGVFCHWDNNLGKILDIFETVFFFCEASCEKQFLQMASYVSKI